MLPGHLPSTLQREARELLPQETTGTKKRGSTLAMRQLACVNSWSQQRLTLSFREASIRARVIATIVARAHLGTAKRPQETKGAISKQYRRIVLTVEISRKPARALLDSRAQGTYMSYTFALENRIPQQKKKEPYHLTTFDGSPVKHRDGKVNIETRPRVMRIGQHTKTIAIDITKTKRHDIILGISQLKKHNLQINQRTGSLYFPKEKTQHAQEEDDPSLQTKRTHARHRHPKQKLDISTISQRGIERARRKGQAVGQLQYRPIVKTDRQQLGQPRQVAELEEQATSVPKEYEEFRELFLERPATELPDHQPWDHRIPLKEGEELKFRPIYSLSQQQLEVLLEYLDKNLKRGFI